MAKFANILETVGNTIGWKVDVSAVTGIRAMLPDVGPTYFCGR